MGLGAWVAFSCVVSICLVSERILAVDSERGEVGLGEVGLTPPSWTGLVGGPFLCSLPCCWVNQLFNRYWWFTCKLSHKI